MDHRDLVSIHSEEEDTEVRELVEATGLHEIEYADNITRNFWLGGNDRDIEVSCRVFCDAVL